MKSNSSHKRQNNNFWYSSLPNDFRLSYLNYISKPYPELFVFQEAAERVFVAPRKDNTESEECSV